MELIQSEEQDSVLYPALSKEIPPPTLGSRPIKILITTLVLFVIFNVYYLFVITEYDYRSILRKWTLVDVLDSPADVVILGDSATNAGISPAIIEAQTGKSTVNLALNANWTFYNDVWVLEHYIEKFGPPSTLIWGHVYDLAPRTFEPVRVLGATSSPYGFSWQSQYLDPIMSWQDVVELTIIRLFPLYFRDETTRTIAKQVLSLDNPIRDISGFIENRGFGPDFTVDVEYVNDLAKQVGIRDEYAMSLDNIRAINAFLQIIDKYQIPTYVVIMPVNTIIGSNKKFQKAIQSQHEFWTDLASKHTTLDYNPEISSFDSQYMYNADHLNVYGAEIYTQYLVDWIWGDGEAVSPIDLSDSED